MLTTKPAESDRHEDQGGETRPTARGLRRLVQSVPRTLWAVIALWGVLLIGASVLWPMAEGYDEPEHIDMAYVYSANPFHLYGPGQLPHTRASIALYHLEPGFPPRQLLSKVPIPPRSERPSFAQLGGHAFATGSQPNQMVGHPPLYYWLEAVVLRLPGVSGLPWDLQVWMMRLLSVVFMLPLPLLAWATAKRLLSRPNRSGGLTASFALVAAAIPLTVPNLIRDGASVNNDSLLILTTSVVLYLVSRVLTGDLSRRTAIWIAAALAAALLTKGFALVLPAVILAAYVAGGWRSRDDLRSRLQLIWRPLVIVAVGAVVGGLWWLRNLVDYGAVEPNGYGPGYSTVIYGRPDNHGTLGHFIPAFIADFINRIWGGVGVPDKPLPGPFIIYGWFFVVMLGVAAALLCRGYPGERLRALVLFSAAVLTVLVVAKGSYGVFVHWSHGVRASQGRYIYPVMVVIAALATIGWARILQPRLRASLLPAIVVGAVITNLSVWFMFMRSWYAHGPGPALHSLLRWSPLPPSVTLLLVIALPAACSVIAIIAAVLESRRFGRATDPTRGSAPDGAGEGARSGRQDTVRGPVLGAE